MGAGTVGKVSSRATRPTIVVVALLLTVLLAGASIALAVRMNRDDAGTGSASPTTATPDGGAPTTAPEPTDVPRSNLSAEQARTVDELKAQVSDIRGLEWKADLPIRIVSGDELARRVGELNTIEREKDPDQGAAVEAVLKLLQLIPADLDFEATIDKLLAGGVLGFYDDEVRELFVSGDPESDLDPATKSTMVHELTHALTDQHFNFGDRNRALADQDLAEESYALGALVEGDAELVRALWTDEHLSAREQREAELGGGGDPSVYFGIPQYILDSLLSPYVLGMEFVSALHDEGGFAAVDGAYRQPPTSTEDILHPDLYVPGKQWVRPSLPDLAAATGCTAVDTGSIGEFDMAQVLDQQLPGTESRDSAAGWNGDVYSLVRCGSTVGMADRWRADTPADLTELADSLGRWARGWSGSDRPPDADGRFSGPSGAGRIVRSADRLDIVIAGDASTSDRLLAAVLAA